MNVYDLDTNIKITKWDIDTYAVSQLLILQSCRLINYDYGIGNSAVYFKTYLACKNITLQGAFKG